MPLDSIHNVIHQFEQQPRWRSRGQFRQVLNSWAAVVGDGVARQAAPVRLDQDVLHVAVVNPMWAQTLTLERRRILDKLNDRLHLNLSDIRFSSGDWYRQNKSTQPSQTSATSLELPEWLRQHPSYEPRAIPRSPQRPETPQASFDRWAGMTQQLAAQQPLCPSATATAPRGNSSAGDGAAFARSKGSKV